MNYKESLQPRAFVFENVVGLLSMDNGRLFPKTFIISITTILPYEL